MDRLRRLALVGSLLMTLLLITPIACGMFGEPEPDVATAQRHTSAGLTFEYPGNWKTEVAQEHVEGTTITTITVSSKFGNAVALVQQFQPRADVDRDQVVHDFFAGVRGAVPELATIERLDGGQAETIHRRLFGESREGRRLRYAIEMLGEKVPHTVDMVFAELDDRLVIVYAQIPDEDRGKALPGFDLVMDSLALE
jgi:hypothetical protein